MIVEAFHALKKAADETDDLRARNTLCDIYGVMMRAPTTHVKTWAPKVPGIIKYVLAGHYCGNYDGARKILNRRSYITKETENK